VDLVHDIPVKVMRAQDIEYFGAPEVPVPQARFRDMHRFTQAVSLTRPRT
jgi:hypothetical protein